MNEIIIIAAIDRKNGIGLNGSIPWNITEDMQYFKEITSGHTVVMGRKTYESIGKPLENRRNIIISSSFIAENKDIEVITDPKEIFKLDGKIFIIGGSNIYKFFINYADKMFITQIEADFKCDSFFPVIEEKRWQVNLRKSKCDKNCVYDYNFYEYSKL